MKNNIKVNSLAFEGCFHQQKFVLMEGALGERLKREYHIPADEMVGLAAHIYNEKAKQALNNLFSQYFQIAEKYNFPIMITTPTRRANRERIMNSDFQNRDVIADNMLFLKEIAEKSSAMIYTGGLMGCKGDAYGANKVLYIEEAFHFHSWQAEQLARANADFLYAGIMPALSEAIGMAKAMEATGLPYIISFMICKNGRLLDGTSIHEAIIAIDNATKRNPLCYMTNCVHPKVLNSALSCQCNRTDIVLNRFKGIQANTSPLSPEELDGSCDLKTSDAVSLADDMMELYHNFGLKIFGGCCGTDNTHMEEIAKRLRQSINGIK
jgi:S-methylmethionine-dependent homocysteine/selenocysteine methylase